MTLRAVLVLWFAAGAVFGKSVLILAGRLIDVRGGRVLENQRVLVNADRIMRVGPNVSAPTGARIIDLSHFTVLPGLIDSHTHILLQDDAVEPAYDDQLLKESIPYRTIRATVAVRLALMTVPRHQTAELTAATLADAARTLSEWRRQVARWAESPSRRIPEPVQAAFLTAFDRLDAGAVLSSLSGLAADETVPPGARFEAFVYADRVLGLDLPRDIGR